MSEKRAPAPLTTTQHRDIAISCDDGCAWGTSILVDGSPVDNVSQVEWSVAVGEPARATIYCHMSPADLTARSALFLPAAGTPLRDRARLAWAVLRGKR